MRQSIRVPACVTAALMMAGCASKPPTPDLGEIYTRAAMNEGPDRNPVIVIPGILGSRLVDDETGRIGWGAFSGDYADPRDDTGMRIAALPMTQGVALRDLRDRVRPDGVLDRVKLSLVGLPVEAKAYVNLLATLGAGGYRDASLTRVNYGTGHFTCFQFAYDWRRDNAENAVLLHAFIEDKAAYIREERRRRFGEAAVPVKFDVVAHSMGGLVARYYTMYGTTPLPDDPAAPLPEPTWAGASRIERLVLVGTPNAGAARALTQLCEGAQPGPFLPRYPAALLGTYPSIYQLLPRARHDPLRHGDAPADPLDAAVWKRWAWGLAGKDADASLRVMLPDIHDAAQRRAVAIDHLHKCLARARQFHAALDRPATPPPGLSFHLFAGDAAPTLQQLTVDRQGKLRAAAHAPGDGTVTRASALLDERLDGDWSTSLRTPIPWSSVTFLHDNHLGMTRSPAFSDNVLFRLLEAPRVVGKW